MIALLGLCNDISGFKSTRVFEKSRGKKPFSLPNKETIIFLSEMTSLPFFHICKVFLHAVFSFVLWVWFQGFICMALLSLLFYGLWVDCETRLMLSGQWSL